MSLESVANDRLRYMRIGYARVLKADGSQSLDLQRDALRAGGGRRRQRSAPLAVWRQRARIDPACHRRGDSGDDGGSHEPPVRKACGSGEVAGN